MNDAERIAELGLTPRQREVLLWITRYIRDEGYPPTVREIGKGVGITSPNGVCEHLAALVRKGVISRRPTIPRSIRILKPAS